MSDQFQEIRIGTRPQQLMREGKISLSEMVLLSLIEGLSSCPKGCFATNKYLAMRLGVKYRYIQKMIVHLKELNLVVISFEHGTRLMEVPTCKSDKDVGKTASAVECRGGVPQDMGGCPTGHGGVSHSTPSPYYVLDINKEILLEDLISMGFIDFPEEKEANKSDLKFAIKLREIIDHRTKRSYSLTKWADDFRQLREVDGIPEEQIQLILDWYQDHFEDEYIPKAYSSKSFRDKFLRIEDAYNRNKPPEQLEMTPDGQEVLERLQELHWPKGSSSQLPESILRGLNNFEGFLSSIDSKSIRESEKALELHPEVLDNVLRFVNYLKHRIEKEPREFIYCWMNEGREQVIGWNEWSGNLSSLTFSVDHKRFQSIGIEISDDYSGSSKRWNQLMEIVNENN